jgi:hypothetical protein
MEHWQFLIQKQGDRAWQPLESPTLKILAGKYRVLARSHLPNTDVEVRVTHSSIQEVPPKRRIFKRLRRTNADGLMAVIPFTELTPGIWDLRCSGDLMTDMLGESWQYSLLLKVHPQELSTQPQLGSDDRFDNQLDVLLTQEDQTEEDIIINQLNEPVSPVWFKGETAEQLLQSLIDLALPAESLTDESTSDDWLPISPDSPLQLSLEKDTYITAWGKTLTVNGDVKLAQTGDSEAKILSITSLDQLELLIELRSPSESQVLTQVKQTLTNKVLPFTFSTAINIPSNCESKLILADISLYGAVTDGGEVIFLGSHAFIITANVTELLTIPSPQSSTPEFLAETTELQTQPEKKPQQPANLGLELFNLGKTSKKTQSDNSNTSTNKNLPPRIKPAIVLGSFSPELPNLPRIHKNLIAESLKSEGNVRKPPRVPPINLEKLVIKSTKASLPFLKKLTPDPVADPEPQIHPSNDLVDQLSEIENIPELLPSNAESRVDTIAQVSSEELIKPKTPETSPLIRKWMHSQGYFLPENTNLDKSEDNLLQANEQPILTLNVESPAVEIESLLNLDGEIETPPDIVEDSAAIEDSRDSEEIVPLNEIIPTWLSQEVVLDDTYTNLSNEDNHQSSHPEPQPLVNLSNPELESLPTPQLFLPNGELLAGTSIKVRLELSAVSSSVVVKLWVEDYQTRSLLDGPHLLKDLRPTPWGNWEAITQLMVPLGCLEIRVGAIALDLTTQQESGKVTVLKTVIPPDLPTIEPDELLRM